MGRPPADSPASGAARPVAGPHLKGLRKMLVALRPPRLRGTGAGPCEPSPLRLAWGPPRFSACGSTVARRLPSRVHDATNLLRMLAERLHLEVILVSLCLADECHRPNCQRAQHRSPRPARYGSFPRGDAAMTPGVCTSGAAPLTPTDTIGRCRLPHGNSPRPSSESWFVSEATAILRSTNAMVNYHLRFFRKICPPTPSTRTNRLGPAGNTALDNC